MPGTKTPNPSYGPRLSRPYTRNSPDAAGRSNRSSPAVQVRKLGNGRNRLYSYFVDTTLALNSHTHGSFPERLRAYASAEITQVFTGRAHRFVEIENRSQLLDDFVSLDVLGEYRSQPRSQWRRSQVNGVHVQTGADDPDLRSVGTGTAIRGPAGSEMHDFVRQPGLI